MFAKDLLSVTLDAQAWHLQSEALRSSADVLWDKFVAELVLAAAEYKRTSDMTSMDVAFEYLSSAKLLYGLALETGLKALIIKKFPDEIEIRITVNGHNIPIDAEVKSLGISGGPSHNLLALAEKAEIFSEQFSKALVTRNDKEAFKDICRNLSEIVMWRGRYPAPMRSFTPLEYSEMLPAKILGHYMRDFLDPVMDTIKIFFQDHGHINHKT
jgi:hypothetical protein